MSTLRGDNAELPVNQRETIAKCEQIVDNYRRRQITKASAVRTLTTAMSASETGLDDSAIDANLDSYLVQLDDTDRLRKDAGQELQQRFRGRAESHNDVPERGDQGETQQGSCSTLHTSSAREPHHRSSSMPRQHASSENVSRRTSPDDGSRSPSYEPTSDEHHDKRQRPDTSKFPWSAPEQSAASLLRPELCETLFKLKEYGKDVKFCRSHLINSAAAPEFPDTEWLNILNGRPVDLDHVLSSIYALSSDDKHIEHLGDVELRYRTVTPVKTVQSAGDWVIAWQRTTLATAYAFPHRRAELDAYHSHIFSLFSAVDKSLHQRVIHYDRAVRKKVGSVRNLLLSDVEQFGILRTQWIDSCGANVISGSDGGQSSRSGARSRRDREACIRWNKGFCTAHPSDCRYRHVCSVCGGNHTRRNCKRDQQ